MKYKRLNDKLVEIEYDKNENTYIRLYKWNWKIYRRCIT